MFRNTEKALQLEKILHKTYMKLLQLFGIIAFVDEGNDLKTSGYLMFLVYIRMILYFAFFIFSVYLMVIDEKTQLMKTTAIIWATAALFYTECTWIYTILRRQKHIELYLRIKSFDKKLAKLHTSVNFDKHVKHIKIETAVRTIHIVIPTIGQVLMNLPDEHNYYSQLCSLILFCTIAVMNTLFSHMISNYIRNIKERFAVLNVLLSELLGEIDVNIIESSKIKQKYGSALLLLSNVCYLHHYLTKLVKLVNHVFGFNLVVLFTVGFINIVIGLFYCSSAFQSFEADWKVVVGNLLLAIFYAADILYICHLGQYAIEEAKKAGLLIHKIETSDYDIKDEIEMFSLQIANEKVEFNAAGFFPINYTLVFSIIGGVTTYLIILIQLAANKSINSKTST